MDRLGAEEGAGNEPWDSGSVEQAPGGGAANWIEELKGSQGWPAWRLVLPGAAKAPVSPTDGHVSGVGAWVSANKVEPGDGCESSSRMAVNGMLFAVSLGRAASEGAGEATG